MSPRMVRMSHPIIPGKLSIPPRPAGYLRRPRLEALWNELHDRRLVLVTAGAGSGKTTLLSAAAADCARPVAWYSLDEMDADDAVFRDHLLAAVSGGATRSGGDVDRDLAETVRVLREHEDGAVLVLDDLQLAAASTGVLAFIERLVRYLPVGHTLTIVSREPLDIATMKLRTQGAVAELTAADLAFRPDEVAALFAARFPDAEIEDELAAQVAERTEGWAAGLEILLQSLETAEAVRVRDALSRLGEAGSGWFAYFAEEILRQLPAKTRDFMRRSSLLPRLDSELCDAALDIRGSGRILADLSRRNLFTVRLGRRRDGYRYHGLFRDVLRELQAREGTPAEGLRLQRRAARILESRGAWGDAMLAHAEGGAHGAALSLLEKRGEELLASGRHETVRRALEVLPRSSLARRPLALLVQGRVHEAQGNLPEAEAIYRKALPHATSGRRRVELMCMAAQVKLRLGRYQACINLCRKALREPGRADAATRGKLLDMIGISMCDLGRLDEGERHLHEARDALGRSRNADEARTFYLLQSNIHFRRGDFHRAKDAARRALVIFRRRGDLRQVCHCLGVLSHITADACEVREARELAREGLRLAGSLEDLLIEGYCRLALGRCAIVAGDLERAREHYAAAAGCGERVGESGLLVFPQLGLAETARRTGRRHEARRLAQQALAVSVQKKLIYQEAQARFLIGELAGTGGDRRRQWRAAERTMRRVGMRYDLHDLLLTRLDEGDVPAAERPERLAELLNGVAEMGHDFLFAELAGERALRVLPQGLRYAESAAEAARHLFDAGTAAVHLVKPLLRDDDPDVRERAAELLDRIGGGSARAALGEDETEAEGVPLRIRALGALEVDIDDRRLTLDDWRSKRALRLFQYLLVRRFRWVPRDEVIEALWPDTDLDKGLNSLRQTLHVLRRTLSGGGKDERSDRYVRYRNEALRLEPGDGYDYDVEQCETSLRVAETLWSDGEAAAAAEPLLVAERLYRGHFLAESPYEEFTVEERERLRDRLLQDLGRLCAWYARRETWSRLVPLARRAVGLDPYHEEFHKRLVEGLAGLGHRAEALEAYHQYETLMVRELDLLPSNRLKALAERLAAGKSA